jgi:hypothetical protein
MMYEPCALLHFGYPKVHMHIHLNLKRVQSDSYIVSWKLSGHAIRIATELDIHHSFYKALEGDPEHFLRARLWYML